MSQVEQTMSTRQAVPEALDSSQGKLVYLYLTVAGEASLDELSEALDLPLISLCGLVETLETRGILMREGDRYRVAT